MVHIAEATVGRRYAGWFIRNAEHTQRVLDSIRESPLPSTVAAAKATQTNTEQPAQQPQQRAGKSGAKVAWANRQQ